MKKYPSVLFGLVVFVLIPLHSNFGQEVRVEVTNPLNSNRTGEMVVVRWDEVKKYLPDADVALLSVIAAGKNEQMVRQVLDVNNDGAPDELLFRDDFQAKETKSYMLRNRTSNMVTGKSWTDARFMTPREDLAWENDRIAFRMYGPALAAEVDNGIDVWCKRVRSLVIEQWYKDDENKVRSYHEDHGEGADFFSVGRSLGAGGSALWNGYSLLQPGVFESYKILATGPLRAIFELKYKPVSFNGTLVREVMRISLDAGSNLNRIDVTYTGAQSASALPFAVGIVKRKGAGSTWNSTNHWVSLWGLTTEKQEEGYLGTGAVMPGPVFKEVKEDTVHILIVGVANPGKAVTYYAGGGWTRSGDFENQKDWELYLDDYALRLKTPLTVRVSQGP